MQSKRSNGDWIDSVVVITSALGWKGPKIEPRGAQFFGSKNFLFFSFFVYFSI